MCERFLRVRKKRRIKRSRIRWVITSGFTDLSCAIRKLLNILAREDPEHNHAVLSLFEPFLGFLQCFGIDEPTVDLGPASVRRDVFALLCVLHWRNSLPDRIRVLRKLLGGFTQDTFWRGWRFFIRLRGGHNADSVVAFFFLCCGQRSRLIHYRFTEDAVAPFAVPIWLLVRSKVSVTFRPRGITSSGLQYAVLRSFTSVSITSTALFFAIGLAISVANRASGALHLLLETASVLLVRINIRRSLSAVLSVSHVIFVDVVSLTRRLAVVR